MSGNEGDFWVCQYCTAGNWAGEYTANVLAATKTAEQCATPTPGTNTDTDTNTNTGGNNNTGSSSTSGGSGNSSATNGTDSGSPNVVVEASSTTTATDAVSSAQQTATHVLRHGFLVSMLACVWLR
eukprot:TRINITY_DN22562_c0_g1_i2.p1 TRINITY_DN22562_c0_g1~~TRINITY_DN22562_c0_g1_i2.p1  ORF type:complete len:126 (-),score=10.46 TRINITY_DN22562_c0_g1_i2:183-560(-)